MEPKAFQAMNGEPINTGDSLCLPMKFFAPKNSNIRNWPTGSIVILFIDLSRILTKATRVENHFKLQRV
ncbi:hypothetical protein IL306_013826 [Fusarium sp. DS 682]|nr:hypothetical protein IL306_013826 [Fusarium sp. DS 682]